MMNKAIGEPEAKNGFIIYLIHNAATALKFGLFQKNETSSNSWQCSRHW